jgi:magnesium chelatase family protein
VAKSDLSDYLLFGGLSLDGKTRAVRGVLSIAMLAGDRKIPNLLVCLGNAQEASVVDGISLCSVRTLTEVGFLTEFLIPWI